MVVIISVLLLSTVGCLFSRATNFENGKFEETILRKTVVSSLQSAIRVVTIEFPLIFDETNFMKVLKIHEIHKISSP